jgi:hypothetical protein
MTCGDGIALNETFTGEGGRRVLDLQPVCDRPARYGEPSRFDTMPSQAATRARWQEYEAGVTSTTKLGRVFDLQLSDGEWELQQTYASFGSAMLAACNLENHLVLALLVRRVFSGD